VTADLPGKAVVSADYAHGDFEGHLSVRRPGEPASHTPHPSAWLTAETRQTLFGMLYSAAHLSSFAVPPTVITTCPRLARQFADEHGNVVVKSASGPPPGAPALEYVTLAGLA
jgi:hypothetical protein